MISESRGQDVLFGMTRTGGIYNRGTVYQINTDGTDFYSYQDFNSVNASSPGDGARLSQISEMRSVLGLTTLTGSFVGLTEIGSLEAQYGTRVQIIAGTSGLYPSTSFRPTNTTGINPSGGFLTTSSGKIYAVMSKGGQYGAGTLFYSQDALAISSATVVLANFNGTTTGRTPRGTPILGRNGNLYGMTESGGAQDLGVIYSLDIIRMGQPLVKILDFDGAVKGANPVGSLIQASNGRLYGMTKNGGTNGHGVIFSIQPDGSDYKKLVDLNGAATGSYPTGSLVQFTDGNLYGMTSAGGNYGFGTIFRISPTGTFAKIFDFDGISGKAPGGDLLVDTEGTSMYGTTFSGGSNDMGVLFRLRNGSQFSKVYDYTQTKGSNPVGSLSMKRKQFKLTVSPLPNLTPLSAPYSPVVLGEVDLPVYFVSADSSIVAVRNNKLVAKRSGPVAITAIQPGNHEYMSNQVVFYVVVNRASQTIKFDPLPAKTFGDAPFNLTATSSSGLPIKFIVASSSLELTEGNKITIKGAGHFTISAQQAGDDRFEAATPIEQHLFVDRASQTITFNPPLNRVCCDNFQLSATASAGLAIQFKSSDQTIVRISGTYAEPLIAGKVNLIAYQGGNSNYKPIEKQVPVEIAKGSQIIFLYDMPGPFKVGDPPTYFLSRVDSNLPITYASDPPGIAVVEGNYLYFLSAGTTTITASQPGNSQFEPAFNVWKKITVGPATSPGVGNTITFPDPPVKTLADAPFNLRASATSGLPVSYTSSNESVARITGNLVTLVGEGSVNITAIQPGNDTLAAATPVVKTLQVGKGSQLISFSISSPNYFTSTPIVLPATTYGGGLPITYTLSDNSLASIDNYNLTLKNVGKLTITASQPGNDKYGPAVSINQTINIAAAPHAVYVEPFPEKTYGDEPFDLKAWSTAGHPVTFTSSNPSIAGIEGSKVTIHTAGTVTINASSAATGFQSATTPVKLVIRKAKQTITFPALPFTSKKFGDAPFYVDADASSGLLIIMTTTTPGVIRADGPRVSIVGSGSAELVATQPGNINFEPAESVSQQFTVAATENTYEMVGTSLNGGSNHSGVVFSLNSSGTSFGYLKQFDTIATPDASGFIRGVDGRLYGTFQRGGSGGGGSIVRMEADGTGFIYLHHMQGTDGAMPFGNLAWGNDGYLYGTNTTGGVNNGGTLFRLKPDGSDFKVIFAYNSFTGRDPNNVILRSDGKLYGMTKRGGFYSVGTFYKINTDGSDFSVIYHLKGTENGGGSPPGSIIQGANGNVYGANNYGGLYGFGSVFRIHLDGIGISRIIDFDGTSNGGRACYELLMASDNKLYGMTGAGGVGTMSGTIYRVNADGTEFTELHRFNYATPESLASNVVGKLIEGADGYLYGTTGNGQAEKFLFRLRKDGSDFSVISRIGMSTYPSEGPIIESDPGVFFGVMRADGDLNRSMLFRATSSGEVSLFGDFHRGQISPRNLVTDATGDYYYGVSQEQSEIEGVNIFRINARTNKYEEIYKMPYGATITTIFCASTGHIWVSGLSDGVNYLFRMNPDGTGRQDHTGYAGYLYQKQRPVISMVEKADGYIYGLTQDYSSDPSLFFAIKNDGFGGFAKLATMPSRPSTGIILGSEGNFYVAYGDGSICKIGQGGELTKIFDHPYPSDHPSIKKLIELNGGRLAAVTGLGGFGGSSGAPNRGSIFTLDKDGKNYQEVYAILSTEMTSPVDMLQTMDGWLYVVSKYGGSNGKGLIYKLRPDGSSLTKIWEFNGDDAENPTGILFRKVPQSFTFEPLPEKSTSDPAFEPVIVSSSGAPVNLTSSNPNVAIIDGGQIKPVGPGTTTIVATLSANANFYGGGQIERILVVSKRQQAITFDALPKAKLRTAKQELNAVSTSGLPVSYKITETDVATVSGSTITFHRIGSVTITASQEGNNEYEPALSVTRVLEIYESGQSISFTNPGNKVLGGAAFALEATASSDLKVEFVSSSDKIKLEGSQVTMLKAGSVTIVARHTGNDEVDPASDVAATFCINPPKPFIIEEAQGLGLELRSSNEQGNQWYFSDEPIEGAEGQKLLVSEAGTYKVVTTVDGCISEPSASIVFAPTAVEDLSVDFSVYPNPATRMVYVEIVAGQSNGAHVELLDATGRTLQAKDVAAGGRAEFELAESQCGVMFIKIVVGEKSIVRKVVKY